jgi:hypothetical protein
MPYLLTRNPDFGKFWRVLKWKMLVYYMVIWSILQLFGIFCGHLVYFMVIWFIFPRFGTLYQEKSGNPDCRSASLWKCQSSHFNFNFSIAGVAAAKAAI